MNELNDIVCPNCGRKNLIAIDEGIICGWCFQKSVMEAGKLRIVHYGEKQPVQDALKK
jgi:hypothetical protein